MPTQTYDQIVDRLRAIDGEFERLARFEKLTASQERTFYDLTHEFEVLDGQRKDHERARDLEKIRSSVTGGGGMRLVPGSGGEPAFRTDDATREGIRGRALDALDGYERSSDHLTRGMLDAIARGVDGAGDGDKIAEWVLVAGDSDYRTAFGKLLRDPHTGSHEFTEAERAAFARARQFTRAMSLTDSAGGYLVPFQLDPAVILSNGGTSNRSLRSAFRVVQCTGDVWHGVSSAGVTARWGAEASETSDNSPTFAQPSIPVYKGDAFVPVSIEAYADMVNAESEIAVMLADAKERLESTAFIVGTGSGQPTGLVTAAVAASKTVASASADALAVADVYSVKRALPARWRSSAGWLGNEDVYDIVRQFATGSGPQSAFWADFSEGTPPQLLGKPTFETSEMDGTLTASANNYLLAYGDLAQYVVADRIGLTIELVPHLFGENQRPTGQRGFYAYWRVGGDLVVPDAVRILNC